MMKEQRGRLLSSMLVCATNAHVGQFDKGVTQKDLDRIVKYTIFYNQIQERL